MVLTNANKRPGRLAAMGQALARMPHDAVRLAVLVHNLFDNQMLRGAESERLQIGVLLRGGLGDVIIAARWLRNVFQAMAEQAPIAAESREDSPRIWLTYSNPKRIATPLELDNALAISAARPAGAISVTKPRRTPSKASNVRPVRASSRVRRCPTAFTMAG